MQQFLFILDLPASTVGMSVLSNATVDWSEFEAKADAISKQHKGCTRETRNTWLCSAEHALPCLLQLQGLADLYLVPTKAFLISGELTPLSPGKVKV